MMHTAIPSSAASAASGQAGPLTAPTLIFAGDSMTADSQMGTPGAGVTTYTASHVTWIRWLTGRRLRWDPSLVFATPGFTTGQWITIHMPPCVAACQAAKDAGSTPVVVLRLGTNDLSGGASLSALVANFETIFSALNAAGALAIAYLATPRSGANALSAASETTRQGLNGYLASKGRSNAQRVIPYDPNPFVANAAAGGARSGYQRDGLHGTAIGYAAEAQGVAAILNALAPPVFCGQTDPRDVFDAASNPGGNRLANGLLSGSAGYTANGAAGQVASGWYATLQNSANTGAASSLTGLFAKTAHPVVAGLEMQQVTLGGAAGGGEFAQLYQPGFPPTGLSVGDMVEAEMLAEWDAGLAGVSSIGMILNANYAVQSWDGASGAGYGPLPAAATRLTLWTPPFALTQPALGGNLNFSIRAYATSDTAPVAAVIRFSQVRVRKVG